MDHTKTDTFGFNEDDFLQRDGAMQELTVKITLCEYRNLIIAARDYKHEIDRLSAENKTLADNVKAYGEALRDTSGYRTAAKAIASVLNKMAGDDNEEKPDADSGKEASWEN